MNTTNARDLESHIARLETASEEMAKIVAARTGQPIDVAEKWLSDETSFNAGAAVNAGLVHRIAYDAAPITPEALRAKFAPINGPFHSRAVVSRVGTALRLWRQLRRRRSRSPQWQDVRCSPALLRCARPRAGPRRGLEADLMPSLPPRICQCGQRVAAGALCACQVRRRAATEKRRPTARQRGYDSRWETESVAWLALPGHEFCACGCGRRADMVDHRIPHRGDPRLFWTRSNWQPMARQCNSRKAAREEGGFATGAHFACPENPIGRSVPAMRGARPQFANCRRRRDGGDRYDGVWRSTSCRRRTACRRRWSPNGLPLVADFQDAPVLASHHGRTA